MEPPLVSCIMPTADRRPFVPLAIRQFQSQDYANRELIVLDDGSERVEDLIPNDSRIHYHRLSGRRTVGAKRNLGCEKARGEIIVHWDDDDMMAPWRLSYQVGCLMGEGADACGINRVWYVGPTAGEGWEYVYPQREGQWVCGGSLCYTKALWRRNPFQDVSVGEDNLFVWSGRAGKLLALADNRFYVATIHSGNVSPKATEDARWERRNISEIREIMSSAWESYAAVLSMQFAPEAPRIQSGFRDELVSCIMVTGNRPRMLKRAIASFLAQDYSNKELIIFDCGSRLPYPLPAGAPIRYHQVSRAPVWELRNHACREAAGVVISHWADDAWRAPDWLTYQVKTLMGSDAQVCGAIRMLFFDPASRAAWRHENPATARPEEFIASLCHTRSFPEHTPFCAHGGHGLFLEKARSAGFAANRYWGGYVARLNRGKLNGPATAGSGWTVLAENHTESLEWFISKWDEMAGTAMTPGGRR